MSSENFSQAAPEGAVCGKWMTRKRTYCTVPEGHKGACRTNYTARLVRQRERRYIPHTCRNRGCEQPSRQHSSGMYSEQCTEHGRESQRISKKRRYAANPELFREKVQKYRDDPVNRPAIFATQARQVLRRIEKRIEAA